jgi:hypothetical protein
MTSITSDRYFLLFVDDYGRKKMWVYFLKLKSEFDNELQKFQA